MTYVCDGDSKVARQRTKRRGAVLQAFSVIMFALLLTVWALAGVEISEAKPKNKGLSKRAEKISKIYCASRGKIAQCMELPGFRCMQTVKPMVMSCLKSISKLPKKERADEFMRCFSLSFSGKYSSMLRQSPECVTHPNSPGAAQPMSAEVRALARPLTMENWVSK